MTLLCDGRVTCGSDDPLGLYAYGNAAESTILDIWNSPQLQARRWSLISGNTCPHCMLWGELSTLSDRALLVPSSPLPSALMVEPTVTCNLRCVNWSCGMLNGDPTPYRSTRFMSLPLFQSVVDQFGPELKDLYFYHYGDPFCNPEAAQMLRYARKATPNARIFTSTNGIALVRPGLARELVADGLVDSAVFTISGVTQEAYARYHRFGKLKTALAGMEAIVREKHHANAAAPYVIWRYLVFNFNDSDEEIQRAREMAAEIGVDRLEFMLTPHPDEWMSTRRRPGSPGFRLIADSANEELGYRDRYLTESGLYDVEESAVLGKFRWTAGKAHMDVVAEQHEEFNVRLSSCRPITGGRLPRVTIKTPWEIRRADVGYMKWADNKFAVPADVRGIFQVNIEVDETWVPAQSVMNNDCRTLGVALAPDLTANV